MANTFVENYKPNKDSKKIDEDGNIVLAENVQVILESTITDIEE